MFKDKILLFFDALLDLFEGNNKIVYYKVILYRHKIQNVISTSELLKILTDFIIVPSNYEILKQQHIQKTISCDLNICGEGVSAEATSCGTPETFSTTIFGQLEILLNSCNIENQKIIWKWIDNIIQTVSIEANIDIFESYLVNYK